jgi:hypothetical protein
MTHVSRAGRAGTRAVALGILAAVALVACDARPPSVAPGSQSAVPVVSVVPSPSPAASSASSALPTSGTSPSAAAACPVAPQNGRLPSDRLTDLKVSTSASADTLTFVFGPASLGGPAGAAQGSLAAGQPPYTQAGSGAAIAVVGEHVIRIRFTGMSLQNDAGEPIYVGPSETEPGFPALRDAVQFDASEGVVGWYVGYDGPGCVTLGRSGSNVTVTIAHG